MRGIVICDRNYMKERNMNLKLNNELRNSISPLEKRRIPQSIKEERRRTGRYIAILVGICLFLLAIYHAWVRRIPIVASLVVPALIMFVYVGWVLYTASRDKHKLLDAEAAREAAMDAEMEADIQNNLEVTIAPNRDNSKTASPEETGNTWADISTLSTALIREVSKENNIPILVKPLILVNDMPTEDLDVKNTKVVDRVGYEKFKCAVPRRKFKRRFCRSKRNAVFKRSYSIA